MRDEGDLAQERARGEHAERILEDDLVAGALDAIEREVMDAWRASGPVDHARREDCWRVYKLSQRFRSALDHHMKTGRIAAADLLDIEKKKSMRERFRRRA